jgi:hypothetical protein
VNHLDYLRARDLPTSPAYAKRAGFAFLDAEETKRETGFASPSIRIDYRDLRGNPIGFSRWRLLDPTAAPDGRKFTQKKKENGAASHRLYFPPFPARTRRAWSRVATNVRERIIVTEGPFKAAAAVAAGFPAIGLGGVDGWAREWGWIAWAKRPVDVAFDSDILTNPDVRRAALALADFLVSLGAVVRIRVLSDVAGTAKTGLDDFLKLRGADEYERAPVYGLDHELVRGWRQDLLDGSGLPDFDLAPLDAAWLTEEPAPIEFTIDPILPRGTVALLVAEGGMGKTHLGLDLARSVAAGDAFLDVLPTRGGVAVYVALEDPPEVLRRRVFHAHARRLAHLRATRDGRATTDLTARTLEHLRVASLAGQQLHLIAPTKGSVVQTPALDALIDHLRALGAIELLILDPMARLHGTDENANATGTAIVNAAERIAREVGCAVVITHHTGKAAATRDDAYAARGASGIADAARVVLRLRALTQNEADRLDGVAPEEIERGVLKLIHAKSNYAPRFQDVWLKRDDVGRLVAFTPRFRDADDEITAFLVRLRAWWPAGATLTRKALVTRREEYFPDAKRNETDRLVAAAIERGDLRPSGAKRKGGALYELATREGAAP